MQPDREAPDFRCGQGEVAHPGVGDLRRKDFIAVCALTKRDVTAGDLIDRITKQFREAEPFMAWQARALKLPF